MFRKSYSDKLSEVPTGLMRGSVVTLRALQTIDFMTAKWAELPYDLLGKVSNRIMNEVRGVSRVVYDISGKPPATIEWA